MSVLMAAPEAGRAILARIERLNLPRGVYLETFGRALQQASHRSARFPLLSLLRRDLRFKSCVLFGEYLHRSIRTTTNPKSGT